MIHFFADQAHVYAYVLGEPTPIPLGQAQQKLVKFRQDESFYARANPVLAQDAKLKADQLESAIAQITTA